MLAQLSGSAASAEALTDAVWSRRSHHHFRFAVPFADRDDLIAKLSAVADGTVAGARTVVDSASQPVFVLSGMGPQWWRMGRDLLSVDGPFARAAAQVDEIFTDLAGWSIRDELRKDEAQSRVTSTEVAQPANFLVQGGLAAELASFGVHPSVIVGHSVGEVSAAYLSGALSLADAVRVSFARSRLQARTAGSGGMLAVGLSEADAGELISGRDDVCIAAVNSPSGTTLAGTHEAIGKLSQTLSDREVFARALRVEVPYHSHLMDPTLPELGEELSSLQPAVPHTPLYSTVLQGR